jgi:SAM-dependent methyltransferase
MVDTASGAYAHAHLMSDRFMERALYYQAAAIWPREQVLFERWGLHRLTRVVDLGCGTGEICSRLATLYPGQHITALDVVEHNIAIARQRHGHHGNLALLVSDACHTPFADHTFDLAVNRHLMQVMPQPRQLIEEMRRIVKPDGVLYFLAEDYGMLHRSDGEGDMLWQQLARQVLSKGTDLMIGRKLPALLLQMGFSEVRCDYVSLDSLNTAPDILGGMFQAWQEGYSAFVAEHTGHSLAEVQRLHHAPVAGSVPGANSQKRRSYANRCGLIFSRNLHVLPNPDYGRGF